MLSADFKGRDALSFIVFGRSRARCCIGHRPLAAFALRSDSAALRPQRYFSIDVRFPSPLAPQPTSVTRTSERLIVPKRRSPHSRNRETLRIDTAHHGPLRSTADEIGSSSVTSDTADWQQIAAAAGCDPESATEQLQRQADELMAILRQRRDALDDRENGLDQRAKAIDAQLKEIRRLHAEAVHLYQETQRSLQECNRRPSRPFQDS